jgi:hypothetical protein
MRRSLVLTILGAAVLGLVGPVAPVGAALGTPVSPTRSTPHHVDVGALPVRGHPRSDFLTGRVLHTAEGNVVTIPVPTRFQDSLELLGRSPRGWVVGYHHASAILEVGRSGRARTVAHYGEDYEGAATLLLSSGGRLVAVDRPDEGDAAHVHVVDLTGRTVAHHLWTAGGQMVGFRGRTLFFSRWGRSDERGPLVRWTLGSTPVRTAVRGVALLDLAHRQVVRTLAVFPQYRLGIAPLGRPDSVRWRACETCRPAYLARAFSPDGRLLAGERGTSDVTFRRASDGRLVGDLALSRRPVDERWEDSHHLLIEVVRNKPGRARGEAEHTLVRCGLHGRCTRVTAWQHHWLLGYPGP